MLPTEPLHPERRILREELHADDRERVLLREWLVSNGLGGYASGTVAGVATRRYHGLLIAAFPAPRGRWLMLADLAERIRLPDRSVHELGGSRHFPGPPHPRGGEYLAEFRLEAGLPVWRYELPGAVIEKRILMPHEQNTVLVRYRLLEGEGPLRLKLLPALHSRSHDAPVSTPLPEKLRLSESDSRYEFSGEGMPTLRMRLWADASAFTIERQTLPERLYEIEETRGYEHRGPLWSPGYFRANLTQHHDVLLLASAEPWETAEALSPEELTRVEHGRRKRRLESAHPAARQGVAGELVLAADQFLIKPVGRSQEEVIARAEGDEVRTVIAGYHWFTDWGRDTMISLEGLTLTTGRHAEAGYLLRTFGHYVRDGLLPNLFPEGQSEGLYHTADATMWFFHAVDRYLAATGDLKTRDLLLPKLVEVAERHLEGTRFGIGVDPGDGLLRQGEAGYQLTWMDAKVDDWVVTPRRGKAVEINGLWYNALRLLADWTRDARGEAEAERWAQHAERTRASFNRRFWYPEGEYLYDVVDGEEGDDPSCRPNQLLAIAPKYPVLDPSRWEAVVRTVERQLFTPVGLRSLSPDSDHYAPRYYGDIYARDAAYHQGTVWGWLVGPFVDAWLKVYPHDKAGARKFLEGFEAHLSEACVGSISEIFDAEPPYTPRGCVAQAWSVAEVLRCWVKTAEGVGQGDRADAVAVETGGRGEIR